MGQKVSPVGLRIGVNKDWDSKWFANKQDYATYLHEDIKIRELISNTPKFKDAVVYFFSVAAYVFFVGVRFWINVAINKNDKNVIPNFLKFLICDFIRYLLNYLTRIIQKCVQSVKKLIKT